MMTDTEAGRRGSSDSIDKELDWLIEKEERHRDEADHQQVEQHPKNTSPTPEPQEKRDSRSPSPVTTDRMTPEPQEKRDSHSPSPVTTYRMTPEPQEKRDSRSPSPVTTDRMTPEPQEKRDSRSPSPVTTDRMTPEPAMVGDRGAEDEEPASVTTTDNPLEDDRIGAGEDRTSDGDDYEGEYEMTDDQRQAMQELHSMKLDLGYTEEEPPPDYDVTERVRQLNAELANDPTPLERERSIKFKDNLVDLVAPPADFSDDEEEGVKDTSGTPSESPPDSERTQPESEPEAHTHSDVKPEDKEETEDKVLLERNGKFELVSKKDLSPEERQLYGVEEEETTESDESHDPHPPSEPRPATANGHVGGRGQGNSGRPRRAQSAPQRGTEFNSGDFDYNSPYALSPEEKKRLQKQKENDEKQSKQSKEQQRRENDEKKEENNDAFLAWLRKKREDASTRRQQEQEERKRQEDESNQNVSEEDSEERDPDGAFNEWVKVKQQQKKSKNSCDKKQQQEMDGGWYVRPRKDCDKAFKEWLKKKNQDLVKVQKEEKQKARIHTLLARRSRKSLALARAIKQAQSFRYVDYYGYRF